MTATLTQVRQALATVLSTIDGLKVYAFRAHSIVEPAAVIVPAPGEFLTYRVTMDGQADMRLLIGLFVDGQNDEAGTLNLDAYLADSGASSIYATVRNNSTLGGVVTDAAIEAVQNHGSHTYAGNDYYGVEFPVGVML